MSEDSELEYLKRKKLLEMQKHLLLDKAAEIQHERKEEQNTRNPKDILNTIFTDDAWKMWYIAEQQYPQASEEVTKALTALIEAGKIQEKVTGEQVYWLFKQLGFPIRIETKIRIFEGGELKSLADKLRNK